MPFTRLLLITLLGVLATAAANAGPLYRWVDEQGKVHYGDKPPVAQDSEAVDLKFIGKGVTEAPAPGAAGARAPGDADPVLNLVEPDSPLLLKPSPQRCALAKQRLQVYSQARRLESTDEFGQRQVLSDAERQKYIAGAREDVERACAGQ